MPSIRDVAKAIPPTPTSTPGIFFRQVPLEHLQEKARQAQADAEAAEGAEDGLTPEERGKNDTLIASLLCNEEGLPFDDVKTFGDIVEHLSPQVVMAIVKDFKEMTDLGDLGKPSAPSGDGFD